MKYLSVRLAILTLSLAAIFTILPHLKAQTTVVQSDPKIAAAQAKEIQEATPTWKKQVFGPAMAPLWLSSIVLVAIVINRFRTMSRARVMDRGMIAEFTTLVGALKLDEAEKLAAQSPTRLGRAWSQGLKEFSLGGLPLNQALTDATLIELKPLRQHLWLITAISVMAPMFGLIGTVVGMILTFSTLAETGGADKAKLAVGLSFALYKTAGGLIVAIPAIFFGRYFHARVQGYGEELEADIQRVCSQHSHALARVERGSALTSGGLPS